VAGLEPEVKETLPVETGEAFPVVAGLGTCEVVRGLAPPLTEVVSGLLWDELNPKGSPDCSWYIV